MDDLTTEEVDNTANGTVEGGHNMPPDVKMTALEETEQGKMNADEADHAFMVASVKTMGVKGLPTMEEESHNHPLVTKIKDTSYRGSKRCCNKG